MLYHRGNLNMVKADIIEDVKKILMSLKEEERRLFSRVIKIERDNLHLQKPKVKDDILKAVREVIK